MLGRTEIEFFDGKPINVSQCVELIFFSVLSHFVILQLYGVLVRKQELIFKTLMKLVKKKERNLKW